MKSSFQTIGLIGKFNDNSVQRMLTRIISHLHEKGCTVLLDDNSAALVEALPQGVVVASREQIGETCDLAVVVAGDGTLLNVARSLVDYGVPLLGVNLGRLGFLVDVCPEQIEPLLDEILGGRYDAEDRILLQARIVRDGETISESTAFNDVVVHKWEAARMIEIETSVGGQFLNRSRSDGLIVSTPTGSTAYALSGGGPILHPALETIVLVPICPHTMSLRPLVLSAASELEIVVNRENNESAQVTCDGQVSLALQPGDRILVNRLARKIRLLHPQGHDYFDILRNKLHWGKRL